MAELRKWLVGDPDFSVGFKGTGLIAARLFQEWEFQGRE
jgi:hypothetical protein